MGARCLFALILLLASSRTALATSIGVEAFETLTLTLKTPADPLNLVTDLDIVLRNPNKFQIHTIVPGSFNRVVNSETPVPVIEKGFQLAFVDPLATIPVSTQMNVAIKTTSSKNEFDILALQWSTAGGGNVPIAAQDWQIGFAFDPVLTIMNDDDLFLTMTDLTFLIDSPELSLGAQVRSLAGFTLFESAVTIAPHSAVTYSFPEIQVGNFIYIEATEFVSDAGGTPLSDQVDFRFGHQAPAPVPEPTSLVLVGVGVVGLIRSRRRSNRINAARPSSAKKW